MSDGQHDVAAQPLVIVRKRRGSNEEAHHGGVWKIAYADFMTAMMAFFLVMWLVNAADKKTIVQVAAYFNPVRLTEKSPSTKGVSDPTSAEHKKQSKQNATSEAAETQEPGAEHVEERDGKPVSADNLEQSEKPAPGKSKSVGQSEKDEALFSDPMGVLDKLASKAALPEDKDTKTSAPEAALRDPFDPAHRSVATPIKPEISKAAKVPSEQPTIDLGNEPSNGAKSKSAAKVPTDGSKPESGAKSDVAAKVPTDDTKLGVGAKSDADAKKPADDVKPETAAESVAQAKEIDSEIKDALAALGKNIPNVEVKATPEGVLISLTDSAQFGMFAVGSAEPRPELVVAVARVAEIVKEQQGAGAIIVRGHTDGRAYRSGAYDNWRLSAARAQISYHMLVRGGVDAQRVVAIEGHADRDLKVPDDPTAAQNRRIDILIRKPKP